MWNEVLASTGCATMECIRGKTAKEIKDAARAASDGVSHPIKLILEPGFGPVVDGVTLFAQIQDAVKGMIRTIFNHRKKSFFIISYIQIFDQ